VLPKNKQKPSKNQTIAEKPANIKNTKKINSYHLL
jgi:hypothetical protein